MSSKEAAEHFKRGGGATWGERYHRFFFKWPHPDSLAGSKATPAAGCAGRGCQEEAGWSPAKTRAICPGGVREMGGPAVLDDQTGKPSRPVLSLPKVEPETDWRSDRQKFQKPHSRDCREPEA